MLPLLPISILALAFKYLPIATRAQAPGSIVQNGLTEVSAMMMFLANEKTVMILDKVEGNPAQINGHSAWAATWDIETSTPTLIDMETNPFCSSGMHLPNGTFVTFGGNGAIGPGGNIGSVKNPSGASGLFDATYQDWDGSRAIRFYGPCDTNADPSQCQWFDNSTQVSMLKQRWYSTAESLPDGSVVLIGGFVNGGYINRNYPNTDPTYEGGAAEPTYEFFPAKPQGAPLMQFMVKTSGLNSYAHAFQMPSGKMFVQANYSTILWDWNANIETPLPDVPNQTVRVYPASGGVAMLPLTPENDYTPTILLCGGQDGTSMPDVAWGDYANPAVNTWSIPATNVCHRITPEPTDGSQPDYTEDDPMLEGRTMGQFIILPDGTLLMINGGQNGTAGYATMTGQTPLYVDMPYGMSLAAGPVLTPAIYNPKAQAGQRWSRGGLQASTIPRLYHSSALLLPDGSVMVAGSNPNVDYNVTTIYPTEYRAERFYPWYWGMTRPIPQGVPTTLSYGGSPFDITLPPSSYSGDANAAAQNTTVVVVRPGFTTHAMNMGQRYLQLNSTFTVSSSGITLHVSQMPPNPNLFTPGPALIFVVVDGVPSNGTTVTVGNGQIGTQPVSNVVELPPSVTSTGAPSGAATNGPSSDVSSHPLSTGYISAIAAGGAIALVVLCGIIFTCCKRKKNAVEPVPSFVPPPVPKETYRESEGSFQGSQYALTAGAGYQGGPPSRGFRTPGGSTDSGSFAPPMQNYGSNAASNYNLVNSRTDLHSPVMSERYSDHPVSPPPGAAPPMIQQSRFDDEYDRPPPSPVRRY